MSKKYEINILSAQEQELSKIKDGLRCMAWKNFKSDYKEDIRLFPNPLEFYKQAFTPTWKESKIVSMTMDEVLKYLSDLGMTVDELMEERSKHYQEQEKQKIRYKAYLAKQIS